MPFLSEMQANGLIAANEIKSSGLELQERYRSAKPFPHIIIDDFLPQAAAELCLREFPRDPEEGARTFDRPQERLKTQFNPDLLSDNLRTLFYSFNSRPFIRVIENITGIKGLIPDPHFLGAGFHEVANGGHLSIHADFNHHKPMNLERRINILIYLNKDWQESHGGQLEFWSDDMSQCVQSVVPVFNRCVIFNTTSSSWHGNPNLVAHPEGRTRKSIALYYYTATWSDEGRDHTTQFKVRKGTADRPDWQVRKGELIADLMPPALTRGLRRMRGRLRERS